MLAHNLGVNGSDEIPQVMKAGFCLIYAIFRIWKAINHVICTTSSNIHSMWENWNDWIETIPRTESISTQSYLECRILSKNVPEPHQRGIRNQPFEWGPRGGAGRLLTLGPLLWRWTPGNSGGWWWNPPHFPPVQVPVFFFFGLSSWSWWTENLDSKK